jgi:eukaryotic-like serine/threonine-protein kinase
MTGANWVDEDSIIVGHGIPSTSGVIRISATAGAATPTPIVELAKGELFHTHPQLLPGGRALLVEVVSDPPSQDNAFVDVISMADRSRKTLVRGAGSPRYLASGHLVYTKGSTLLAVPFDLDRLEIRGTAVPVLDDVAYDPIAFSAQYDVSDTGTLVYRRRSGAISTTSTAQWIDATGKREPFLTKPAGYYGAPRVSPDGNRIAMAIKEGANQDIWVYEPKRDAMTRLTFGGRIFANPLWTPDGRHVVFGTLGSGLRWTRADGAGQTQVLMASSNFLFPTSFTRDGTRLAFFQPEQLWSVRIERQGDEFRTGTPERLLSTKVAEMDGVFSQDGRWLAYSSKESGRFEVWVRALAANPGAGGGRWLISTNGGVSPAWSPNGRDLLYQADDQIMTVGYRVTGDSFVAEKPRVWTAVRAVGPFDLAPDGRRVAVFVPVSTSGAVTEERSVVFILNFFEELRQRAAALQ